MSNGKSYIGQASRVEAIENPIAYLHNRYTRGASNEHFWNSLKSYRQDFQWEILKTCDTQIELDAAEDELILLFETMDPNKGYNKKRGGSRGKFSDELRQQHSNMAFEVQNRPEVKQKQASIQRIVQNRLDVAIRRNSSLRETLSKPEIREKYSKIQREVQNRPDIKARASKIQIEAQNRPEVKQKRSSSLKKSMNDPSTKERHRQACSKAQKLRYAKMRLVNGHAKPEDLQLLER